MIMSDGMLVSALSLLLTSANTIKVCPNCLAQLPANDTTHRHPEGMETWPDRSEIHNRALTYIVE